MLLGLIVQDQADYSGDGGPHAIDRPAYSLGHVLCFIQLQKLVAQIVSNDLSNPNPTLLTLTSPCKVMCFQRGHSMFQYPAPAKKSPCDFRVTV